METTMPTTLKLSDIHVDGGTQPRAYINPNVVGSYAEDMEEGAKFPPITVFYDGQDYWLADGFHRIEAARRLGAIEFAADIKQGTRRDAILYSAGANASHGLRRTNEDKRRAVTTLLEDAEWRRWSSSEISRRCGVSDQFVLNMRASLPTVGSENGNTERTYTTKHGTIATMNTGRIGRKDDEAYDGEVHTTIVDEWGTEENVTLRGDEELRVVGIGNPKDGEKEAAYQRRSKLYHKSFDLVKKMLDTKEDEVFEEAHEELYDTVTEYRNEMKAIEQ
jgi:hypothetical protein